MTFNWDNYNFIDYLNISNIEINNLPKEISISTMCSSCKLNTKLNILNIENYLQLNTNDILSIKINTVRMRTLLLINKSKQIKKNDIVRNYFYNQITVVIRITHGYTDNLNDEPKINMKLFKNGSVQMSGCKNINNINIALNKLIFRLKEIKAKLENGIIIEKLFIDNIDDIDNLYIKDFKIDMINSNYKLNMQIDRLKLYNLLLKKKIKSIYEPCIRACVIIKYIPNENNIEGKEISIFIFQKGNIIITGARSKQHIISSYEYINNILLNHYEDIIKKDDKYEENLIFSIYNDILKDIEIGLIKI